jgi:hypothetical protein
MPSRMVTYAGSISVDLFPHASRYTTRTAEASGWREPAQRPVAPFSERHLQCVWFDPRLRPQELETSRGEKVTIVDPGVWNLESGPDFLGASVRIGPGRRQVAGDVEVHVHPSDWKAHGHASDPAYSRVRFHVTFFPGAVDESLFPRGTSQIALRDALHADPQFSFESIDVTEYPYGARAAMPPCSQVLRDLSPDEKAVVLEAAGEERLRRKAERMAVALREKGPAQAVYEECLCALGYKHNKLAGRMLADRLPVAELREHAAGDATTAYALLLGVAGLIPLRASSRWDRGTRAFVRTLWDTWWKHNEKWASRCLDHSAWRTAGVRPANHPARRLMAAACWFTRPRLLNEEWQELAARHTAECLMLAAKRLEDTRGTYWDRRLSFSSRPGSRSIALVGRERITAILGNVLVPYLAALNVRQPFRAGLLSRLPAEAENTFVRRTAFGLFGRDHNPSLYRSGLRQQGLLQIFHDYCLNDRSRCASCEFPALVARQLRSGHD